MSLRIGKVELSATQRVEAQEARTLVGLRVPGQAGGVQQNLGREPTVLLVEGLILGEKAQTSVERLRTAYATGEPQSFAGDIAVGTELTDVIVEDLHLLQLAGTRDRYQARLRLREHVEPPGVDSGFPGVDLSILSDLESWVELAKLVYQVVNDPRSALDILKNNKLLRDKLGIDKVENLVSQAVGNLLGVPPEQVKDWLEKHGGDLVEAGIALAESPSLLPDLVAIGEATAQLVTHVADGSLVTGLTEEGPTGLGKLVKDLGSLVSRIEALLKEKGLRSFVQHVARALGLTDEWNKALNTLCTGLDTLRDATNAAAAWLEPVDALLALVELFTPAIGGTTDAVGAFTQQLQGLGIPLPGDDIASTLPKVKAGLTLGTQYAKAILPSPASIRDLARRLSPELRNSLAAYSVEAA